MTQKVITKTCKRCKEEKETSLFPRAKENKDGLNGKCRECVRELRRKYYKNNTEYFREYNRSYTGTTKGKIERKNHALKALYNISIEEYNDMFIEQGGRCAICGKHQSEFKSKLCVDHDHGTDEIRGLLCKKCNFMLGNADDNIDILQNAVKYLEIFLDKEKENE